MPLVAEANVQISTLQLPKSTVQFAGTTGAKITDASGVLSAYQSDGSTLTEVKGATPTTNDSFATKSYVDTALGTPFRLSGTTSSVTASNTIPANAYVTAVVLQVTTALDGSATIDVGTTSSASAFVANAAITEGEVGTQQFLGDVAVGGSAVTPKITIGGSPTTGAWVAWIYYATPKT